MSTGDVARSQLPTAMASRHEQVVFIARTECATL